MKKFRKEFSPDDVWDTDKIMHEATDWLFINLTPLVQASKEEEKAKIAKQLEEISEETEPIEYEQKMHDYLSSLTNTP